MLTPEEIGAQVAPLIKGRTATSRSFAALLIEQFERALPGKDDTKGWVARMLAGYTAAGGPPLCLPCDAEWPICPHCPGQPLVVPPPCWPPATEQVSCRRCRRTWSAVERLPCPEPATVEIRNTVGDAVIACPSHAARSLVLVTGLVVIRGTPLRGPVYCAVPDGPDRFCRHELHPGQMGHRGMHEDNGHYWPHEAVAVEGP